MLWQLKMGLLTSADSEHGRLLKGVKVHYRKISLLLYVGGVLWFFVVAVHMSVEPYFSHNAFLTGLAKREFGEEKLASNFHIELVEHVRNGNNNNNSMPDSWLVSKFQQMGIEAYVHRFAVKHPLKNTKLEGKNVYGIVRSPRGSSTEAIVLSAPFRPLNSEHKPTAPSIALMLALAKFAVSRNYWAKDIIFLVSEHEQYGPYAWLQAYHEVCLGQPDFIEYGRLSRRSGILLGAINLELHDTRIGRIDLKIEGFNGQLPNLDLIDSAVKMLKSHGVYPTFKRRYYERRGDPIAEWGQLLETMLLMVSSQAAGFSNGNHGAFLSFGVHSFTLEGFGPDGAGFREIGRVVEALLRCVNNLVQGFHASFFFYLLTSTERFVPIGVYMPAVVMMAGALFIKAFAKWMLEQEKKNSIDALPLLASVASLHLLGFLVMKSPKLMGAILPVEDGLFFGIIIIMAVLLFAPKLLNCEKATIYFNIFALVELGIVLTCLGMTNISLAVFVGVFYAPVALWAGVGRRSFIFRIVLCMVHPAALLAIIALANAYLSGESGDYLGVDAIRAGVESLLVGNIIYGQWIFSLFTAVLIPNWLCLWIVSCSRSATVCKKIS